jgi:Tol biopolymer transport system component
VLPAAEPGIDTSQVKVRQVWADSRTNSLGMPSPDGRYLSFVDWETGDLAVRDLVTGENIRLTGNAARPGNREYAYFSTISPDSRQVAYAWFNEDEFYDLRIAQIPEPKSLPLLNTSLRSVTELISSSDYPARQPRPHSAAKPRTLYRSDKVQFIKPAGWSEDGKYILALFFGKSILNQIVLVSVEDGSVQVLKHPFWIYPKKMSLSPDGRFVVYGLNQEPPYLQRDIFILPTDGSPEITLVKHVANDLFPVWAPDGKNVLFASDRDGTLDAWLQAVEDGHPLGPPIKVKTDIGRMMPLGFTRDGAFFHALKTGDEDGYFARFDPDGGKLLDSPRHVSDHYRNVNRSPDWSPDGSELAFLTHVGTENQGLEFRVISIRSTETGEERQLDTPRLSYLNWLRWAPDGKSLLVGGSDTNNNGGLYQIDAQTGEVTPVIRGPFVPPRGYLAEPAPDGKGVYYVHEDLRETAMTLRFRNLETGVERDLYSVEAPSKITSLARSPDGESIAFGLSQGNRTEARRVMVVDAAGGDPRELLKLKKPLVSGLAWSLDGDHLLFSKAGSPTPQMWQLSVKNGKSRCLGIETKTDARISLHPDGHRIAYTAGKTNLEIWAMEDFLPQRSSAR